MSKTIRIGSGAAWWGDRVEPAALNAERGRARLPVFRNDGRGHRVGGAGAGATRPGVPRLRHLPGRPHARGAARLHAPRHAHRLQPGLDQPGRRGRSASSTGCGSSAFAGVRIAAVNGSLITDRVLQLTDRILENGADHRRSPQTLISAEAYLGRRADRRGFARRRADRRHRQGRRSVDLHGADDARVRLGSARSRQGRGRQRHRPPARMRRAGHRRLLLRPRLQGRARAMELRLSRSPRSKRTAAPSSPRSPAPAAR